jgi:hypothetical protein
MEIIIPILFAVILIGVTIYFFWTLFNKVRRGENVAKWLFKCAAWYVIGMIVIIALIAAMNVWG